MKKLAKKLIILCGFFSSAFILTGCDYNPKEEILDKLIPSYVSLIATLVAFTILVLVVIFLAYKPIKALIQKRRELLDKEVNETKNNNELSQLNKNESIKNVAESKAKAKQILSDAENAANKERDDIVEAAHDEARQIIKDAQNDALKFKQEAKEDVKNEIINVALDASKEVLKREVNTQDDEKIIKDFVNQLDKDK